MTVERKCYYKPPLKLSYQTERITRLFNCFVLKPTIIFIHSEGNVFNKFPCNYDGNTCRFRLIKVSGIYIPMHKSSEMWKP